MISSKSSNQNMLKMNYFLKKIIKICQALENLPLGLRWPSAAGDSAYK